MIISRSTTLMYKTTVDRLQQRRKRRHDVDHDKQPCKRLRLILLGDSKVGKTSLLNRFVKGTFDEHVDRTVAVEEMERKVTVDGRRHALRVVDTAGQERFRSLRANFYRGTQVCLLAFALDDLSSFRNLSMWREEFLHYSGVAPGTYFPFIVVGNKADVQQRAVSDLNAHAWCRANGDAPYFETSAKLGLNVEEVFEAAVRHFHEVESQNRLTSSFEFIGRNVESSEGEVVDLNWDKNYRGSSGCCS